MGTPCTPSGLSYILLNAFFIRKEVLFGNTTKDGVAIYRTRLVTHASLSSEGQNVTEGGSYATHQESQHPTGAH